MADLILGPILRYADANEATVWVETSAECEVRVLGRTTRTFRVAGHHFAILILEGLEPGAEYPYEVHLDGEPAWPAEGDRGAAIRTPSDDEKFRLAFGTCRRSLPHEPPFTYTKDKDPKGREVDSLYALSERMRDTPESAWPDALLLIGDQVYADTVSPRILRRIEERRSTAEGPKKQIADFEEYTWLYHESWGDSAVRWLLASLPSAMIFDDHDVIDDWNTSGAWVRDQHDKGWWRERLIGAYMSYWLYQHLGNLTPDELRSDRTLAALRERDGDGEPVLREFAAHAADEVASTRWSFSRDFGRTRMVVLDTRAGRIIGDDSSRQMLSDEQWRWVTERISGDVDHLLIASSLPVLMSPGLHHLEGWNEALCAGAWGRWARRPSEALRRLIDLEHWPAFRASFDRLVDDLEEVGSGRRGEAPASIVLLSGDVHHAYLAEAEFPADRQVESRLVQAVCSPMRNPLDSIERRFMHAALSRPGRAMGKFLARAAGVPKSRLRWEFVQPPTFDNQIGTVEIEGRASRVLIERTEPGEWEAPKLHRSLEFQVSRG